MINKHILCTTDNKGIATILLNRPDVHNAFNAEFIEDFIAILTHLQADSAVRLVVLAAAGDNFSAGADLNWMRSMIGCSYEQNIEDALRLSELLQTLKYFPKPTIARVQGAVYGGAVGLVACCDLVIASTHATFCLSEVKIGLIPAIISPYVIAAIGERAARRYTLTAEKISAQEAQDLGLVTVVCEAASLDQTLLDMIATLSKNSPAALIAAKQLINRVAHSPYAAEHVQKNAEAIAAIRISTEGQEGLTAFLEKRKPAWLD